MVFVAAQKTMRYGVNISVSEKRYYLEGKAAIVALPLILRSSSLKRKYSLHSFNNILSVFV